MFFFVLGCSPEVIVGDEAHDIANISTVLMLLGIDAALLFPLQVFVATLMGRQHHYFINGVRMVMLIVSACGNYYLLMRYPGSGLTVLALLTPLFTLIQLVMFSGAVLWDKQIPRISLAAVNWRKAKELMSFGAKSATMMVASRLQSLSVAPIIGHVIGLGHIVYFVMPNRLVEYAKGVSQAVGFPLTPYFGVAIGRGDHREVVRSWLATTLVLQIVSLAMPVIIAFYGETFLGLWLGREYSEAGNTVLYILLMGLFVDSLAANAFRMLVAQGRHGKCALVWLVLSALSIPLGIAFAYVWGVAGVAAGTTGVTIVANCVTIFFACEAMEVSPSIYFYKVTLPILLPLGMLAAIFFGLEYMSPATSYLGILTHLFLGAIFYVVSVWYCTISREMRKNLVYQLKFNFISNG